MDLMRQGVCLHENPILRIKMEIGVVERPFPRQTSRAGETEGIEHETMDMPMEAGRMCEGPGPEDLLEGEHLRHIEIEIEPRGEAEVRTLAEVATSLSIGYTVNAMHHWSAAHSIAWLEICSATYQLVTIAYTEFIGRGDM